MKLYSSKRVLSQFETIYILYNVCEKDVYKTEWEQPSTLLRWPFSKY